MAGILVFGEVSADGGLAPISLEVAALGQQLAEQSGGPFMGALIPAGAGPAAEQFEPGFETLHVADGERFVPYSAAPYIATAGLVIEQCSPSVVLFPHTVQTRDWVPRLAFRLGTGLVTDCTALRFDSDELVMTKPVYGGSAVGEFVVDGSPRIATIRGGVYEAIQACSTGAVARLEVQSQGEDARITILDEQTLAPTSGPRLKDARIVVSGGRGIGGPENWHFVEEAAAALGAAVGCSRPVTDAGWVPSTHQVGLTGTSVSPDLYLAVGISGAVQHLAGISGARTVVAINTDPEAAIFKRAQYGVVGDYREVLPAFTEAASRLRAGRALAAAR